MWEALANSEVWIRVGSFLAILAPCLALEFWRPFRSPTRRWICHYLKNLSLIVISSLLIRIIFPLVAVGAAHLATERGWGLMNVFSVPTWINFIGTLLFFDFLIYWQHRVFHSWPWLWRLHRVHHSETHLDTTSGIRFHPLEIALSMILKIAAAIALGADPTAVLVFEIVLNATSLFSHMNFAFSDRADRFIRRVLVTPGMHRIHHSVDPTFMNSNFGFSLSLWDRLLRTYRELPLSSQKSMIIGVTGYSDESLVKLLHQPFRQLSYRNET